MPQREVLIELLPIVRDSAGAAALSFQVGFVARPRLPERDVGTGGRERLATSALADDRECRGAGVTSLGMRILAKFATDYLAVLAVALFAFVAIGLPPHPDFDDEAAPLATPHNIHGFATRQ